MAEDIETKVKAMEKVLGEPFGMEYQEDVLKTRRNLLVVGAVAVGLNLSGLHLVQGVNGASISPILGLQLMGMTHSILLKLFIAILGYLLVHFVWASWDAFGEWRLRLTGARTVFQTGSIWGRDGVESVIHPRQSTLYSWWSQQSKSFGELPEKLSASLDAFKSHIDQLEVLQQTAEDPLRTNLNNVLQTSGNATTQFTALVSQLQASIKTIQHERIPTSLARFDRAFAWNLISRNMRWIVLEFGFPTVVGLVGLGMCVRALT